MHIIRMAAGAMITCVVPLTVSLSAQDSTSASAGSVDSTIAAPITAQGVLPARTSVTLRTLQAVTSRKAKPGDRFEIELVNDISDGIRTVIPAGTRGSAEVVHAAPKGFGGRAGELIIAARYLQIGGVRLPLRTTKLSATGSNNTGAAVAATLAVPLAGMFVTGTSVDLPVGQIFVAQTAEDFPSQTPGEQLVETYDLELENE